MGRYRRLRLGAAAALACLLLAHCSRSEKRTEGVAGSAVGAAGQAGAVPQAGGSGGGAGPAPAAGSAGGAPLSRQRRTGRGRGQQQLGWQQRRGAGMDAPPAVDSGAQDASSGGDAAPGTGPFPAGDRSAGRRSLHRHDP